jgi:uncharacterized protein (DUF885 family)
VIRPRARGLAAAAAAVAILSASQALGDPPAGGAAAADAQQPAHAGHDHGAEEASIPAHQKYTENDRLDDIIRQFIEEYVAWSPTQATYLGLHDRDAVLEDRARLSIERWDKELNAYRHALQTVIEVNLDAEHLLDLEALRHLVKRELFELNEMRAWERNPMYYTEILSSSIYELAAKDFAPPAARLKSIVAREAQFTRLIGQAKANLDNPPEVFTRKAMETTRGTITYLEKQLPAIANDVLDDSLSAAFLAGNAAAVGALRDFVGFLEADLLPRSGGEFALGGDRFARLLSAGSQLDADPAALLALGEEDLDRTLKRFRETAREIPGARNALAALQTLEAARPAPDSVVARAEATLAALRDFVARKELVTVPEGTCRVAPMPAFMWGYAAMNSPGPFETAHTDAFYFVRTSNGTPGSPEEFHHLGLFNPWNLSVISIHETYPGHFVQGIVMRRIPSTIRKIGWDYANAEGWAHYTEQMMLDEGFGDGDPRYRLAQLREALIRLCRYVVAIRMHTKGMTIEQATKLFEKKAFLDHATAREEAERGAFDPSYLNYTLGKMAILKLRDDWRAAHPEDGSLRAFHDRFLSFGPIPIPMIRAAMLGTNTGTIF